MSTGERFEQAAAVMLEAAGLQVIERNYRCKVGELDLICLDDEQLVIVEVRARRQTRYGSAAASIDRRKQRRIIRTTLHLLQHRNWLSTHACRFDVVAVDCAGLNDHERMQWIKNAFTM